MGKKKTVLEEKELRALGIPFPDELDRCFRHPSDPANDHASAYMRAVDFAAELGDTLAAHLWQQALEIGLRAGSEADILGADDQELPVQNEPIFSVAAHERARNEYVGGFRAGYPEVQVWIQKGKKRRAWVGARSTLPIVATWREI
ncbi:hypothetical protein K438DRAFT_1764836 [Mycena galopus ATCC 62051]|nr:hypothetical protein K438DRAFT_1764836 [Mycena galopus ATCC 62051]